MNKILEIISLTTFTLYLSAIASLAEPKDYLWLGEREPQATIAEKILPPEGYTRMAAEANSFANWLRHLPLKKKGTPVYLYNGKRKMNQDAHVAVVDIDTGTRDLQQCADAIIRLRTEYLYAKGLYSLIHFKFTSGDEASFTKWAAGYRPKVNGNKVQWVKNAGQDSSYMNFRCYLTTVYIYAGTYSLSKELKPRKDIQQMSIGDVFIEPGFPGHAVIVVDMAENKENGKRVFLLAQSFMPAQDIHVLKNPDDAGLSPWYALDFGRNLRTPEWRFKDTDLRYFDAEELSTVPLTCRRRHPASYNPKKEERDWPSSPHNWVKGKESWHSTLHGFFLGGVNIMENCSDMIYNMEALYRLNVREVNNGSGKTTQYG